MVIPLLLDLCNSKPPKAPLLTDAAKSGMTNSRSSFLCCNKFCRTLWCMANAGVKLKFFHPKLVSFSDDYDLKREGRCVNIIFLMMISAECDNLYRRYLSNPY